MTNAELLLEIGSEAYADLSSTEIAALNAKYSAAQSRIAGLHAFQLLMKKFQATYRMGKTYEALSHKYDAYRKVYNWYCQTVQAGIITATDAELDDVATIDNNKFAADEN